MKLTMKTKNPSSIEEVCNSLNFFILVRYSDRFLVLCEFNLDLERDFLNQSHPITSSISGLFSGILSRSSVIKSLASGEIRFQTGFLNPYYPF